VHEIEARDATVDDAVLDILRNVGCADEQDVDRSIQAREGESPIAGALRTETGVFEQGDRRLAETTLRRDRDPQALRASLRLRRSIASR